MHVCRKPAFAAPLGVVAFATAPGAAGTRSIIVAIERARHGPGGPIARATATTLSPRACSIGMELMKDEAIFYPGKQHAALLIPGLVGTPRDMRFIARALVNEGYTVSVPTLSGYTMGSRATHWKAWVAALRE